MDNNFLTWKMKTLIVAEIAAILRNNVNAILIPIRRFFTEDEKSIIYNGACVAFAKTNTEHRLT